MTKHVTLAELESRAAVKDPALNDLSDNLVFGEGNEDSQVVFVGEAPGEDEDLSGRPFVGRAGQLLDRILESVGLSRDDVYITNIVKFRPPGNRNPTPAEVAVSEAVLLEQLRIIRPQVIATLGNVPTQYFLPGSGGITKVRGTWHVWHGLKVLPLFHPAYLLRNASRERGAPKWQMWQDMKLLKDALDTLPPKRSKLVIDTAEQGALF
ncbi:MAG TPA: uracil-DNA glycosylase [Trueperaceae bacterium]|nr:uracil-DNA glycosylase [Trueperaceae bacterium]